MQYTTQLRNKIDQTGIDREARNKELFEYSRRHMQEYDSYKETGRDMITNLPGLRVFFYEAGEIIAAHPNHTFGVITMDISQFKAVNEFCGRAAGDEMLQMIASLFNSWEKERPLTKSGHARADNFILCTAYESEKELINMVEAMYYAIVHFPFPYKVAPSFGICCDKEPMPSVSFLKDCATIAMNKIKGKFYAHYAVFDDLMRKELLAEKQVENDIINALEKEELQVYIQPKVDMRTGSIVGGEALVRWIHNELGIISPGDFIPVLEKNGFIIQLDYYVWERVFRYQQALLDAGRKPLPISINISRVHVHDNALCDTLIELAMKHHVPPKFILLEITESAFEADADVMLENMSRLHEFGYDISVDDFGTGYSSLKMISTFDVDEVKIDRSFITDLSNPKSRVVLESILRMLRGVDIKYIIEGVETIEQSTLLLQYGCPLAQGFLFYRPIPLYEYDALTQK